MDARNSELQEFLVLPANVSRSAFIEEAERSTPDEYRSNSRPAAEWVADNIGHHRGNMRWVTSIAALLSSDRSAEASRVPPQLLFGPQELVMSELRADWAKPWVEQVRNDVFGATDSPFNSTEDAVCWIQHEEKNLRPSKVQIKEWQNELQELSKKWIAEMEERHDEGMPFNTSFAVHPSLLPYPGDDGSTMYVEASYSPKLRRLSKVTQEMAKATGWQQVQAVMFVLTDLTPFMPRIRLRTLLQPSKGRHGQGQFLRQWAELEIHSTDFSSDDLHRLFKLLRQEGVAQKKPLHDREAMVFMFLRSVDKYQPRLTWDQKLEQWNEAHPQYKYGSVRGLQLANERALKKGATSLSQNT